MSEVKAKKDPIKTITKTFLKGERSKSMKRSHSVGEHGGENLVRENVKRVKQSDGKCAEGGYSE